MTANKRKPISTDAQIKALKPEAKPYDVRFANIPGLYLTVGSKTKTYKWDRGAGQSPRKVVYGHYPAMSLKQAREAHELAQMQHQQGTYGTAITDKPKTIAELAEFFYEKRILTVRSRPEAIRQVLDHDILPVIGKHKLQAITVMTCRMVVEKVVNRGATTHAGKSLQALNQMFRFALSHGFMTSNPAQALEPNTLGIEINMSDRVLTDEELVMFWHELDAMKSPVTRIGLQLLMLLGLRSGELRQAKWTDVDVKNKTLTIPVKNQKLSPKAAKQAKPFVVPLSGFALRLLLTLKNYDEEYVFVGQVAGKPINKDAFHRATARIIAKLDVEQFKPHDLRRTLRTRLSEMKVDYVVAEKCLNHSLGKIVQTYDQHDYLDQRREALQAWSDKVQCLMGLVEANVIQFRRLA